MALDTTFNRVRAVTLKGFSPVITESIIGANVALWELNKRGGVETRSGAFSLVEPVIITKNTNVKSYNNFDTFDQVPGTLDAADYPWAFIGGYEALSGPEKFRNSGDQTQVVRLWDALGDRLAISMKLEVNKQLFGDGTLNLGKDLDGFLIAIQKSPFSVYGNIDSNVELLWRNFYLNGGNISAGDAAAIALFRLGMTKLINGVKRGGAWPDLIITTQDLHEYWETKVLVPNEKYERSMETREDWVRNGWVNFVFKGVPVVWDADMQPNTTGAEGQGMIALTLDYMKFVMGDKGYGFEFTDPIPADNQDSESVLCKFAGNIVLSSRRSQGRVNFQTA